MRRRNILALLLALTLLLPGCGGARTGGGEEARLTILASTYPVYLVKEGDATEWTPFDHHITGFSYRAGFEYRISVVVEPFDSSEVFDDAPDETYTLHQIISCSECRSDGLPEGTVCE